MLADFFGPEGSGMGRGGVFDIGEYWEGALVLVST